jgi:hypothetical protein
MPLIKMLKTSMGADDGVHTIAYRKDEEYFVSPGLAKDFVGIGVAVLVEGELPELPAVEPPAELPESADPEIQNELANLYPPETQAHDAAPEIKNDDSDEN